MADNPATAARIRERLHALFMRLRFLPLYSEIGILPRRSFAAEFWRRVFDILMPNQPVVFSAEDLLNLAFSRRNDADWVTAVADETWMQLYRTFIPQQADHEVEIHLINEVLYALEMLSIWVAAEEMEDELLRLDPSIMERDSNLIAQEREISQFVAAYRSRFDPTLKDREADAAHAWIMLKQCAEQVKGFQRRALSIGSDLKLTYLLERLDQTLSRIRDLLGILDADDAVTFRTRSLALFRQLVAKLNSQRSVRSLIRQTTALLAKSVTNHASNTGEHYVTEDRREYLEMVGKGLGAGVFIAVMGLIKIFIESTDLSMEWATLWVCLNYGLGFVLIHMLHFTVATKQPAMTAAYIAKRLEHANNGSVDRKDLARLIMKVGRSQFAAIAGNVMAALPVALALGLVARTMTGIDVLTPEGAATLMHEQNPVTSLALFYAAIAGIWLFLSGLVAGYVDNRCLYLNLPERIRRHPLLEPHLSADLRNRIARYIGEHSGALWGNFFFGVMLGVTAYLGYLFGVPLDIRHVAFSVANVGYSSTVTWPGIWIFLEFTFFALLIGVVNLVVSFLLALNVAIRSRGVRLGNLGANARAFWREVRNRPWELVLPPAAPAERPKSP